MKNQRCKESMKFYVISYFLFVINWTDTNAVSSEKEDRMNGIEKAIYISAVGAGRAIVGLPIEHPFDTIKTRWQAYPETTSMLTVGRDIISKKGYKGFYSGFIPNTIRAASKQTYRYPMMILFPPMYETLIPDDSGHNRKYLRKIATGLTIANAEVLFINPLERLKVWLMTKESRGRLTEFFSKNYGHLGTELYRGISATLPRQNVSWVSFLWADEWCKNLMKVYTKKKELNHSELIVSGMAVGVINTAVTLPFDSIKTCMQMDQARTNTFSETAKEVFRKNGFKGFYAGWQPRITQYMIQAIMTVNVLDYLEKRFSR